MRPVERGPVPTDTAGNTKQVTEYGDWRADLLDRLGWYCSYCNARQNDSLAQQVEHVLPVNPVPNAVFPPGVSFPGALAWDNLLLACGPCNRAKTNIVAHHTTHLLPDYHNTHLGFRYVVGPHPTKPGVLAGLVEIEPGLLAPQAQKAQATIDLCKLADVVDTDRASDYRWQNRLQAIVAAQLARDTWDSLLASERYKVVSLIATVAFDKGFFSIWMAVFDDEPTVKAALAAAFPNTPSQCFPGPLFAAVERVTGDL